MSGFEDKNVLVVGGSSGIGLELTRRLVDTGAAVTICSRGQGGRRGARAVPDRRVRTEADPVQRGGALADGPRHGDQ